MGKFLTTLKMEEIDRGGLFKPARYKLIDPLVYNSRKLGIVIADTGDVTDLDSTPRIPIFYRLLGNRGKPPAVLHDRLYSKPHTTLPNGGGRKVTRAEADAALRGATYEGLRIAYPESLADSLINILCLCVSWMIWAGVRIGGASHWEK